MKVRELSYRSSWTSILMSDWLWLWYRRKRCWYGVQYRTLYWRQSNSRVLDSPYIEVKSQDVDIEEKRGYHSIIVSNLWGTNQSEGLYNTISKVFPKNKHDIIDKKNLRAYTDVSIKRVWYHMQYPIADCIYRYSMYSNPTLGTICCTPAGRGGHVPDTWKARTGWQLDPEISQSSWT